MRGIGQVAKLLAARAEVRQTRAFRSRTVRRRPCRRECGLEVTVRAQQGRRMKHEHGEGEMERYDMHTANTSSRACARCLKATQRNCVRKICVRHGVRAQQSGTSDSFTAVPSYESFPCFLLGNATVPRRSLVHRHVLVGHPHRDIRLRHPWWKDCVEDVRVSVPGHLVVPLFRFVLALPNRQD